MANNRLYIVDAETGDAFLLAKTLGNGWYAWESEQSGLLGERLEAWLDGRDREAAYGIPSGETALVLVTEKDAVKVGIMEVVASVAKKIAKRG